MRNPSWILVLGLGVGALSAPGPAQAASSPVRHLESQAASVDIQGHGGVEEYARAYFQLAEEYRKHGQEAREEAALRKAVSVEPRRWDRQLRLAALERETNPERAVARLRWMMEQVDEKGTLAQAQEMLEDPRLAPVHAKLPRPPAHHDQKLYVVGLGNVDPVLLAGVITSLSQSLGITCAQLPSITVEEPALRTTLRVRQLDHYMLQAATELGPLEYQAALAKQGLSPFSSLTLEQKETFVQKFLESKENGKQVWGSLSKTDRPQFETVGLIGHLSATYAVRLAEPNCLGILAVSADDLYTGHHRFIFGTATPTVGVINVSRLTPADEPRHLMVSRLGKQALQTAGYVLPLGDCATLTCPRSGASVKEEIDSKGESLCGPCHTALEQTWKRRGGMMTSSLH